jgi:nucleotide-binding universal stress UspA family protein
MASKPILRHRNPSRALDTTGRLALNNILFATDLSPAAEKALPYALEIGRRYGATLHVIHVVPPSMYRYVAPAAWPKLAEEEEKFREDARQHLEEQLQPVPHEIIFENSGEVWPALAEAVQAKQIDLLVLGTRGRSGIEKALMGSIAEKIFREAFCPVLTVGPHVGTGSRRAAGLSRVLYATDFSAESLAAAPYAISLARENRAQLILMHTLENGGDSQSMLRTLRELVPFGSELRSEPVCIAEHGSHGEKILEVAEGHGADLIVLGVAGELDKKKPFQRSALYKIVTQATCPVLTVRA